MNPQPDYEIAYEIEIDVVDGSTTDVDVADLERAVIATLSHLGVDVAGLTIVIADDETVRQMNQQYRHIDSATDILSFPAGEGDEMFDLPPEIEEEVGDYLGDLIIAYPFTCAQAARYHNPIVNELRLLVVHGTLHLLGYDHDTEDR